MKKPPIGLRPEYVWHEERVREILAAISRSVNAHVRPNPEWVTELNERLATAFPDRPQPDAEKTPATVSFNDAVRMLGGRTASPEHHRRYFVAWSLHQREKISEVARIILEDEMDSAQELFTHTEFDKFKKTLPDFEQFWGDWVKSLMEKIPTPLKP